VLKADPSFTEVLEKRDEQANRIKLLERELDLKQRQVEQQITQRRNELKTARQQVQQKIAKLKVLVQPDVERVELALSMAVNERQTKRDHRASLGRSISRLQKALKQERASWSDAERARMDGELADLLRDAQRIDHELSALNEHIRLLKIKRLLLRV